MLSTSLSKNEHAPLKFSSKAKRPKLHKAMNEIMENALPLRLRFYIYPFLKVSAGFARMFFAEAEAFQNLEL